jgi:hypothetical protein
MTQGSPSSSITVNGGTGNGNCSEPTVTETFTDTNANGYYDLGEPFVDVVAPGNTAGRRDEKAAYAASTSGCTGTLYDGNSPEEDLASLVSSNLSPNPNPVSVGSDFSFAVTGIKNTFGFPLFSGTCSVDIIRTSGAVNYTSTVSSVSGTVSNGVCNLVGPASGGKFPDPGSLGELSVKVTVNRILEPPITEFKDFLSLSVYSAASNKAKADGTNTTEPVSGYDLSSTPVPSLLGLSGGNEVLKLSVSGLVDSGNDQALNGTACNFNVVGPSVDNSGNAITPFNQTFVSNNLVGGACSYTFTPFELPLIKGGYSFTVRVAGDSSNLTTVSEGFNRYFDIYLENPNNAGSFAFDGKIPGSATGTILVNGNPTLINGSNPIVSGGASPTFSSPVVKKYNNTSILPGASCTNLVYLDGSLVNSQTTTLNAFGQCITTVNNNLISAGNLQLKTTVSLVLNSVSTVFETGLTSFATTGFPSNRAQSTTFSLGGSLDTSTIPFTTSITDPGTTFIGTAQTFTVSGLKDYANNQPLAGGVCTFNFTKPDGSVLNLPSSPASNGSCTVTIAANSPDLSLKGNYSYTVSLPGTNGTGSGGSPNNVTLTTSSISFVRRFDVNTSNSDGLSGNLVGTLNSSREPLVNGKEAVLTSTILKRFDTTSNLASTVKCRNVLTITPTVGTPVTYNYPGVVLGSVTGNLNGSAQCVSEVLASQITTTGSAVLKTQVSLLDSNFDFTQYGDDFQTADKTLSIVNAYSDLAKAKDAPNNTQPIGNTPTVSINPSFTDQSVTLSVSGLVDSGNDLPLQTTAQICKFNILNSNNQVLPTLSTAPTNGTCSVTFSDNQLESSSGFGANYNFTLSFDGVDSSTGLTLTTSPSTNIQRRFNIYRTSSQLPVAITTSTSGYPTTLIRQADNTLTSGVVQQSNNPANLQAGTSLSALTGKACRVVLVVNGGSPSYYPSTLDGSGRCVANLLGTDPMLASTSSNVQSRVEVSYNDSTFNLTAAGTQSVANGDDFSSANTNLSIQNSNTANICLESFKDDNGNGLYNNGGANGNNQIGQPETLLSGQTISKSLFTSGNILVGSVVVNSTNPYCFNNLFEGDYFVEQTIPNGTTLTSPTTGDPDVVSITSTTVRYSVTAVAGSTITKQFGYEGNGDQICVDPTYIDVNKNNSYNSGTDTLVENKNSLIYLSTDLLNPIGNGAFTSSGVVSNASGVTCFTDLPANNPGESYRIVQTIPVPLDPYFPGGAEPISGLPKTVDNLKVYRDVTLGLTADGNTTFGYQKSATALAKEELDGNSQPTNRPVNTGVDVLTTVNPVYNDKSFVNYPVSAKVTGLVDSGNDNLLNGLGICSATFEGPGFGSGVTVSGLDVIAGECVVDNTSIPDGETNPGVIPTATGNNHTVTFTIDGPDVGDTLITSPATFEVFSGDISVCTSAFADYNGNGLKEASEPLVGGNSGSFTARLIRQSDSLQVGASINVSPATVSNCFAPVAPGVQYRVEQTGPTGLVLTTPASDDVFGAVTTFPEESFNIQFGYTGSANTQVCGVAFRDDDSDGVNDVDPADPLLTNSLFTTRLFDNLGNKVGDDKVFTGGGSGCFTNLLPTTVQTASGSLSYTVDQTYNGFAIKVNRTTDGSFVVASLSAGQNATREFGYRSTADICYNDIYRDYNKDGVRQSGESFISNLATKLFQNTNQIGATQNTVSPGSNCFVDPIPGSYRVEQVVPSTDYLAIISTNPNLSQAGTTVNYQNISLDFGVDVNIGIGYKGISGTMVCANPTFKDLVSPFGTYNPGVGQDELYAGITTTLKDNSGNTVGTSTTNASGVACFDELLPTVGSSFTYKLEQTSPNPATILPTTGSLSKDVASLVTSQTVGLAFGFKGSPQICPVAFRDDDGDSVQDATEPYISIAAFIKQGGLNLTPTQTTPNPIQSANDGQNCFTHELSLGGNYQVQAVTPSGYSLLGGNDTQTISGVQFGQQYKPVFRFDGAGQVCVVSSYNLYNNVQTQVAGLTTNLKNGNTVVDTLVTSGGGNDCFASVSPGTYSVEQVGPVGSAAITSNPANVTQNPGTTENVSFGYTGASSICVNPFNDNSSTGSFDGVRQDGEPFIPDTGVSLYKSPDFTNPIKTTDPLTESNNCFTELYGGDYRLVLSNPPSGYSYTTAGDSTQNFTVPNSTPVNKYFGFTNDPNFNLGGVRGKLYIDRNEDSKIAPHALADSFDPFGTDLAYQSTFDNDVPVTNQEVQLYKFNPLSANVDKYEYQSSVTTVANSPDQNQNGTYSFDGLQPGTYRVRVPLPQGTTSVYPDAGAGNNPFIQNIVISGNPNDPKIIQNNNLSFQYTAKICPFLYVDINFNNQFDPGLDIDLIQTAGSYYRISYQNGSGQSLTESNGNQYGYLLNAANPCIQKVPPREYTVSINDAANKMVPAPPGLGYGSIFNTARYSQITSNQVLTVYLDGQTYEVVDSYKGTPPPADDNDPSDLSGRLWNDKAGNGIYEPSGLDAKTGTEDIAGQIYNRDYDNDTPYPGVPLQLVKCRDAHNDLFPKDTFWNRPITENPAAYFTTRADGTYDFLDVPPGGYSVVRLSQFANENQLNVNRINQACNPGNYIFWNSNPTEDPVLGSIEPGTNINDYHIWTSWKNTIVNDAYIDQNLNGTRQSFEDDNDTSASNLTYQLKDSVGNVLEEIVEPTPGYTSVAFSRIPPGTDYTVELSDYVSNYTPFSSPQLDIPVRTNIATNGASQTLNFGFTPATDSAIEGRVFIDRSRDREYFANGVDTNSVTDFDNDVPLGNYTVELYYGACNVNLTDCFLPENLAGTQNSINDNSVNQGNFSFQNIPEGNYHARVTNPEPLGTEKGAGAGGVRTYWGQGGGLSFQNDVVFVAADETLVDQHLTYDYNGVLEVDSFLDTTPDGTYDDFWEIRNTKTPLSITYSKGNPNQSYLGPTNSSIENSQTYQIRSNIGGENSENGYIIFAQHLPPGDYSIDINPVNKPPQIDVRAGYLNNPYSITPSQNRFVDLPFTPYLDNVVSGQVFIDRPNDLVQSSGYNREFNPNGVDNNSATIMDNDIAINGATVYLQGPPGVAINPQVTAGTGQAGGSYSFQGLPSGRYRVHKLPDNNDTNNPVPNVTLTAGFTNTVTDTCMTGTRCKSSRVIPNQPELWVWWDPGVDIVGQVKRGLIVEDNQTKTNNNTYSYTNHLSASCIDDYNGSGSIDYNASTFGNDPAINGCGFQIQTPYSGETINAPTNLNHTFYDLPPGDYTLRKLNNVANRVNINTARYRPSSQNLGNVDNLALSFTNSGLYQPGYYYFFQTTPVQTRNASITGKVFVDRNEDLNFQADGIDGNPLTKEDNDYYLPNIKLTLTGTETLTNATVNKTITTQINNDGKYQFTDLGEGSYTVTSDLE